MIEKKYKTRVMVTASLLALTSLCGLVAAQSTSSSSSSGAQGAVSAQPSKNEAAAMRHVDDAVAVVNRMDADPRMKELLQQAKGVFIVPNYGRAALGVGASGGAGVLLTKRSDGTWSDPAFYNIGAINIGAQVGAEGGPIAMVLNNDKAVNEFMQKNNFSLSADAGLTVVDWAKMAQGSVGTGDVVVWAGTKGLFGNVATIGVNNIRFNQDATSAYYHQTVAAEDVIAGKVTNPHAGPLKKALAATTSGVASGSSGNESESTGSSGDDK